MQGTIESTRYTACERRIDVQSIRQIAPHCGRRYCNVM